MSVLACVSVPGCQVPLPVLEALSFARDELAGVLHDLRARTGAGQVCVLSTCERTEVYAVWDDDRDPDALVDALVHALAANRGVPPGLVEQASDRFTGRDAARHLLRVTAGLESFVLGEKDIVGQVRSAAETSRATGTSGLELDRLLATAVNTSRRVHRSTRFGERGRSVATAAVHQAATTSGGNLTGQRVLVVGAGQVATEVAHSAARLGGTVTVCNRTKRHADRFAAAGATVVDLARLPALLPHTDLAIFATAAPHRLLRATHLPTTRELLIIDLCVPRNVDPDVRALPGVRLLDLADLRATATPDSEAVTRDLTGDLTGDLTRADQIVTDELDRYQRWLAGRSAAASIRRLRADVDAYADHHATQATRGLPEHLRPLVEDRVRRAVRRLAHEPTRQLLQAAEAGDHDTVERLAGLFAVPVPQP